MTKFQALILASRPKTLFASIGPVVLGLAAAYYYQALIDWNVAFVTLLCAILLQVATNLVNDYYDYILGTDTHERLGPVRVTQAKLLRPEEVKVAFIVCFGLAIFFGVGLMYDGGWPIFTIGLSSVFFAYCYTGGPFPLSYLGLGELFALIFFGPIPVWGTFYLQTHDQVYWPMFLGLAPGFLSGLLMAVNNLRDLHTDRKNNKKTLAVRIGEENFRKLTIALFALSLVIPLILSFYISNFWLIFTIGIAYFERKTITDLLSLPISSEMNLLLARVGRYLFFYCLVLSVPLIFYGNN